MVPSLPLLSCESSVSVKENPDRKKKSIWPSGYDKMLVPFSPVAKKVHSRKVRILLNQSEV